MGLCAGEKVYIGNRKRNDMKYMCPYIITALFNDEKTISEGRKKAVEWAKSLDLAEKDEVFLPEVGWCTKRGSSFLLRKGISVMETKLCKDCKWCRVDWLSFNKRYRFAKCANPKLREIEKDCSLIDGETVVYHSYKFCSSARGEYLSSTSCGTEGKYWESKK